MTNIVYKFTHFLLLATLFYMPSIPLYAQSATPPTSTMWTSPYRSLTKNIELLDTFTAKITVFLNYYEVTPPPSTSRLLPIQSMTQQRYLIKKTPNGMTRNIELGLMSFPEGGYEIYLYGQEFNADGSPQPNPDLPYAQNTFTQIEQSIKTQQDNPGIDALDYQIYHLSYVQSDRAIAMLKSLGYTTVEYTQVQGETPFDKIYTPYQNGQWKLPVVLKLIDANKTSLMDAPPTAQFQQQQQRSQYSAVPDIGGTYLHNTTAGEPQQRLLIAYNKNQPETAERLLTLLRDKIDRPARQIVIEALVIEVNTDKIQELGIDLRAADSDYDVSFEQDQNGNDLPFSFSFNRNAFSNILFFRSKLSALVTSGDAEILSSPSVLVLDGRQARIQVGQQVPVVKSTSTNAGIISSVEYFPVGIVLNLRPRLSEDGTEVTMQVETIVSAVSQTAGTQTEFFVAPTVDNRQVQTFVRVADNTPFIIGGLISTDIRQQTSGVPILSDIPILGMAFKRKKSDKVKKEVIVVLTPHVMPLDEDNFSYVIPKDSDIFNSFDNILFRNAYRIRDDDVFDLKFIYESDFFQKLLTEVNTQVDLNPLLRSQEPYAKLLDGAVPGEEILVRRMIWELAHKTGFSNHIDDARIIVFEDKPDAPDSSGFRTTFTHQLLAQRQENGHNTLELTFDARFKGSEEHPFAQPKASIGYQDIANTTEYISRLMEGNRRNPDGSPTKWTVLLSDTNPPGVRRATAMEVLKGVLVLKRILALNKTLPLTVKEFRVGRQLIFPTEQDLEQRYHVLDRDAARYFFEVIQYYPEFEKAFNIETRQILEQLQK